MFRNYYYSVYILSNTSINVVIIYLIWFQFQNPQVSNLISQLIQNQIFIEIKKMNSSIDLFCRWISEECNQRVVKKNNRSHFLLTSTSRRRRWADKVRNAGVKRSNGPHYRLLEIRSSYTFVTWLHGRLMLQVSNIPNDLSFLILSFRQWL